MRRHDGAFGGGGGSGGWASVGGSSGAVGAYVVALPDLAAVGPDASEDLDAGTVQSTYYLQLASDDSTSMASA